MIKRNKVCLITSYLPAADPTVIKSYKAEMLKLRQLTNAFLVSKGANPYLLESIFTPNTVVVEATDLLSSFGEPFATESKIKADSFAASKMLSERISSLLKGERLALVTDGASFKRDSAIA
jgi:hypothetical protein